MFHLLSLNLLLRINSSIPNLLEEEDKEIGEPP